MLLFEKLDSFNLSHIQKKLNTIEGHFTKPYFNQIFGLLPENLRPEKRSKFKAYDFTNNIFNLAYEMLSWKVHKAVIKAKLEPYLGFLHSRAQKLQKSINLKNAKLQSYVEMGAVAKGLVWGLTASA